MHARRTPAENVFRYRVAYFGLDVDRLDELNRLRAGRLRPPPAGHDPRRRLPGRRPPAGRRDPRLRAVAAGTSRRPAEVRLVTSLRLAGYVFNPVSFWYLAGADGQTEMVVAEVNNTFGERRPYLLEPANAVAGTRLRSHVHPKELHVSPFFGMDQTYRFFLSEPGERLYARIDVEQDGGRPFIATLTGRGQPLTDLALPAHARPQPAAVGPRHRPDPLAGHPPLAEGSPRVQEAAVRTRPGVGAMTLAARPAHRAARAAASVCRAARARRRARDPEGPRPDDAGRPRAACCPDGTAQPVRRPGGHRVAAARDRPRRLLPAARAARPGRVRRGVRGRRLHDRRPPRADRAARPQHRGGARARPAEDRSRG